MIWVEDEAMIWVEDAPQQLQDRRGVHHGRVPLRALRGLALNGLTVTLQRPLKRTAATEDDVKFGAKFIVKHLIDEKGTHAFKGSFVLGSSPGDAVCFWK